MGAKWYFIKTPMVATTPHAPPKCHHWTVSSTFLKSILMLLTWWPASMLSEKNNTTGWFIRLRSALSVNYTGCQILKRGYLNTFSKHPKSCHYQWRIGIKDRLEPQNSVGSYGSNENNHYNHKGYNFLEFLEETYAFRKNVEKKCRIGQRFNVVKHSKAGQCWPNKGKKKYFIRTSFSFL